MSKNFKKITAGALLATALIGTSIGTKYFSKDSSISGSIINPLEINFSKAQSADVELECTFTGDQDTIDEMIDSIATMYGYEDEIYVLNELTGNRELIPNSQTKKEFVDEYILSILDDGHHGGLVKIGSEIGKESGEDAYTNSGKLKLKE